MCVTGYGYVRRCDRCHEPVRIACDNCEFPQFTLLGGMQMLAKTFMAFHDLDPEAHPEVVQELASALGDALLDTGREVLRGRCLLTEQLLPVGADLWTYSAGRHRWMSE
jgi:hypothetical protein